VRLALVITTHERPDALAAVLDSVTRQRIAPAEIVIADDGSGADTRDVTAEFIARSRVPARLVSQEHKGFRAARLRNLGIAATTADYLLFIDGDMVLHPEFVGDHQAIARAGYYTQGVRVLTDAALTRELIAEPAIQPSFWSSGLGGLRRFYLLHSPALARITRGLANRLIAIKSCNLAAWRDDLVRVNGFNEDFEGWGPEDKELCVRFDNAGVLRQSLLFGGIALHLHHAAQSRVALLANRTRLAEAINDRKIRCERGLDAHLSRAEGAQNGN
jgi:glycosyltransferase involved in cell wall biosynthesis